MVGLDHSNKIAYLSAVMQHMIDRCFGNALRSPAPARVTRPDQMAAAIKHQYRCTISGEYRQRQAGAVGHQPVTFGPRLIRFGRMDKGRMYLEKPAYLITIAAEGRSSTLTVIVDDAGIILRAKPAIEAVIEAGAGTAMAREKSVMNSFGLQKRVRQVRR